MWGVKLPYESMGIGGWSPLTTTKKYIQQFFFLLGFWCICRKNRRPMLQNPSKKKIQAILPSAFRLERTVFLSKWMMSTMLFTTTLNKMTNSQICTVFSLGASKVYQKRFFLQNGWILPSSEALGMKTVYPTVDFEVQSCL